MATELLTAGEVSTRLGVDRSTVYRMAMDGRLRAVKVGSQWRFPPRALEDVLTRHVVGPPPLEGEDVPLRTAREAVLHAVAPVLGAMLVVTDMGGRLQTDVANPCPWFVERGGEPSVLEGCARQWRVMAADRIFTPRLEVGDHGFACARSLVRDHDKLVAMVVAGGIAPDPDDREEAAAAGLHHLDREQRARLLDALPHVAAALSDLTPSGYHWRIA